MLTAEKPGLRGWMMIGLTDRRGIREIKMTPAAIRRKRARPPPQKGNAAARPRRPSSRAAARAGR